MTILTLMTSLWSTVGQCSLTLMTSLRPTVGQSSLTQMTRLRSMVKQSNLLTGITVGIQKGITHTSRSVRAGGRGWPPLLRERRAEHNEFATRSSVVLSHDHIRRMCNDANRPYR